MRRRRLKDCMVIYPHKGKVTHVTPRYGEGISSTLCGKNCDGWVIGGMPDALPSCKRCLKGIDTDD